MILISASGVYATATVDSIYPTRSVSGCTPSFKINTTGTEVHPNSTAEINITIWDIKCGLSHVRMQTSGISFKRNHSPGYFATAPPLETKTFKLNITIPETADTGEYPVDLKFTSNEHQFEKSISVKVVERPENEEPEMEENETQDIENQTEEKEKFKSSFFSKIKKFFRNIFSF